MCKAFSSSLVLISLLASFARAEDQASAKTTLDQAIKAHGGEALLGKFIAGRYKAKGTFYDADHKASMTCEWVYQGSDKSRSVVDSTDGTTTLSEIEVVDGKKGWSKENDDPAKEMDADELQSQLETCYVSWATNLVPLHGEGFRLSALEEITVDGRKAAGILVAHEKHKPLKLYFDKETHLLVKYERKVKDSETKKDQTEETIYSDYGDFQGTKQPRKMTTLSDGVKVADMKLEELKLYEKPLDEKLFAKP